MNKSKVFIFTLFLLWGVAFIAKFTWFATSDDKIYSSEHNIRNYKYPRAKIVDRNNKILAKGDGGKRIYRYGSITSHFVGYYDPKVGMAGIEGNYAHRLVSNNQARLWYFVKNTERKAPLKVTLDVDLQKVADEALGSRNGSIVVLDARTGEILALVSHPGFDPNKGNWKELKERTDAPLLNRATKGYYMPGSVWKTIDSIMLLGKGEKQFTCTGSYTIGKLKILCTHPHGKVDSFADAYARSCNGYFMSRAMEEIPVKEFIETSSRFMSKKLPENLSRMDYALSVIGQGPAIEITPMEGALIAQAVANKGLMLKPVVVKGEKAGSKRVMDENTARSLRQLMEGVVKRGTGKALNIFGQSIIGAKTGTAEKELKGGRKINIAWMIGFAKAAKYPVAFAVAIENTDKFASEACSPVVSRILEYYFANTKEK